MNPSTLPTLNVRWLTDSAEGEILTFPASHDLERLDYPIAPESGHAWMERLPLAEGMSLFRGVHRFRPEAHGQFFSLGEFVHQFPDSRLAFHTVNGAIIRHQEFCPDVNLSYQPGHDFFRRADALSLIPMIEGSPESSMTALILSESTLAQLIGAELAQALITQLGLTAPPAVKVLPIPIHVSAPLRAAFSTQLHGTLQRLFAQSKVLEYLCALCTYTAAREPLLPRLQRQQDRIQELHDYLTQLEGCLPSLEDLALQFKISARRLNAAFAEQYGSPIYAFITDWRLNEAYEAIRDSDVALKVVASRLGYSHVNHFNRAFQRKFGHPPGQLRNGPIQACDDDPRALAVQNSLGLPVRL